MVEAVAAGALPLRSKSTSSVSALMTMPLKVPSLVSAAWVATEQVRVAFGVTEVVGKTFYDSTLDATIVCGINAQQIGFDPDKQEVLDAVFAQVADILS